MKFSFLSVRSFIM